MQITEIRVEGVRGFPPAESGVELVLARKDVTPPAWVVVAGRNGAGKSTFLQALALSIAGPSVARLLAETFDGWIRDGEDRALAGVRVRFSEEDGFAAGRKPEFDPWTAIEWTRADGPEPIMEKAAVGGNWTPSRGPWAENPRGWFTAGYGPFRRLSPAPTEAQRLMMLPGRPSGLASLFREDASLSESVRWLQQVYLRRLEGRGDAEELEQLVLDLLDDGLLPEGMRVQRVDSEGLWVDTPDGRSIALKALSDGYRTVAGLVLDLIKQLDSAFGAVIHQTTNEGRPQVLHEGVVFIDEIDVHLHVEWQKRIGFWLKEHFPRIQFIVTTHSPFICQAADVGGLVRLAPAWADGPAAEILSGEAFNRVVNGSADDAILSDLFGLDATISDASLLARSELAQLEGASLLRDLSDQEQRTLRALRKQMPTSQRDRVVQAFSRLHEGPVA
ncbi:ATP-binding protein [Phycicoccus sp. HDW14]|uniref:AAA family ATPase n=1 Tax=Phycicoccus sp. HDW14 TaxID=2714941 RepID=UPI00140B6D3A|nr:ATP-binding protein [Phycicoccus sp. HDW14]QIM22019.1 ATP-binding protein [Phycicoccus sp. HDW14]